MRLPGRGVVAGFHRRVTLVGIGPGVGVRVAVTTGALLLEDHAIADLRSARRSTVRVVARTVVAELEPHGQITVAGIDDPVAQLVVDQRHFSGSHVSPVAWVERKLTVHCTGK